MSSTKQRVDQELAVVVLLPKTSNEEFPHPPITYADPDLGPVPPITPTVVMCATEKIKNGKAPEPDNIPVEGWRLMEHQGATLLTSLFNQITEDGVTPKTWRTSVTVPIWTIKGDELECSNRRPFTSLAMP